MIEQDNLTSPLAPRPCNSSVLRRSDTFILAERQQGYSGVRLIRQPIRQPYAIAIVHQNNGINLRRTFIDQPPQNFKIGVVCDNDSDNHSLASVDGNLCYSVFL